MRVRSYFVCLALLLAATVWLLPSQSTLALPNITSVAETGGDNEATDTVTAKWTGITFPCTIANEPIPGLTVGTLYTVGLFGEEAPCYVDRNHSWNGVLATVPLPAYLVGHEYIMIGNDNRDNANFVLNVSLALESDVYLLIDNRLSDGNNADPPVFDATHMAWVTSQEWQPVINGLNRNSSMSVPDEVGMDGGGDGTGPGVSIADFHSVYRKHFPAGTVTLLQCENANRNMYGVVIVPTVTPPAPTNLVAAAGNLKVNLNWSASPGASSYVVKRSLTQGGPYSPLTTTTNTVYLDTDVVNGTTYYYVVAPVNVVGEGENSPEAAALPQAAPEGLVAVGGTNQVSLSWNILAGAESYVVRQAPSAIGPFTDIASGVVGTTYTDTPLAPATTYYYVVVGVFSGGALSGASDPVSATTAPTAPSLTLSLWAATAINLTWTTTDAVVSEFIIEQATDGVNFTPLATVPGTQRAYLNGGLTGDVPYSYRIQALNAGGYSEYSSVVSLKTPIYGWNVNFANAANGQPANNPAPTPVGYLQDVGLVFADQGNGYLYGWNRDITADGRWRNASAAPPDLRYATFNHMQKALPSAIWEIEIPNGFYEVHVVAGESDNFNSVYQFDIEGVATPVVTPTTANRWAEFTVTVVVNDGRLTVDSGPAIAADLANNNKIAFIDIYPSIPVAIEIGTQPQAQTVMENRSVTLSVVVTNGSTPISYQWYQDDVPVEGATSATLTFARAQMTNAGTYKVVISNFAGTVTSDPAVLTVEKDLDPAKVLSAGSLDGTTIGIIFDELVDPGVALDPNLYLVYPEDGSGPILPADLPILRPDGRSLSFSLAVPIHGQFYVDVLATVDLAQNASGGSQYATNRVLGYTPQDLGALTLLGTNFVGGPVIELTASGTDIWGTSDEGYVALRPVNGDFDARVRVTGLALANAWSKAGLMARVSNTTNSANFCLIVAPAAGQNTHSFQWRMTNGGSSYSLNRGTAGATGVQTNPPPYPNAWLRLTREGSVFSGYISSNGADWDLFYSTNSALFPEGPFPTTMLVGLAATAHTAAGGPTTTATFTDLQVIVKPVISDAKFDGANFKVSFATVAGLSYVVEYKDSLADEQWQALPAVVGDGNVMTVSDPAPASLTRFYRVRVQ